MKNIKSILYDEPEIVKIDHFSSWPQKKKSKVKRENLSDWTQRDFAIYIHEKYVEKFSKNCSINITKITTYLGNIKVSIKNVLGHCNNFVLKDYIDYFYNKYIETYVDREIPWVFNMKSDFVISSFAENYEEKKDFPKKEIKMKEIENCYILGLNSVIREYGIMAAINYLKTKNKLDEISIFNKVARSLLELEEKGLDIPRIIEISKNIKIENNAGNIDNFLEFWETKRYERG